MCPRVLHFQIAQTDGYYSVLTGLLAGFTFAMLGLLITNRLDQRTNVDNRKAVDFTDAQKALVAAFMGLILMSLGYAVASGETKPSGRAASEEVMLGLGFVVSGLLLFYSIVLTMDAVHDAGAAPLAPALFARDVVARFLSLVAALYIYLGLSDYEDIRYGTAFRIHALDVLDAILASIQLIINLYFYPRWSRTTIKATHQQADIAARISVTALGLTFISAIGFGVYEARASLCLACSPVIVVVIVLLTAASTISFTYFLARSRPTPIATRLRARQLSSKLLRIPSRAASPSEP